MSLLRSQLASGGWRRLLWRNPRAYKYSGSFVTAGNSNPTVLKGKGFTHKNGTRGDQLVTLEIQLPKDIDELAKRLDGWKDESEPRSKLGV